MDEIVNTEIKNDTLKLPNKWFGILILLLAFLVSVCNINDPLFLIGVCLVLFLIWTSKKHPVNFRYFDLILLTIWLFSLFEVLFSMEIISSFIYFRMFTFAILFYFIIRSYVQDINVCKTLLLGCCIIIGLLCLIALASFFLFKNSIENIGFTNLYDFRYRYRPVGYLTNVWGALLLCFLGILSLTIIFHKKSKMTVFLLYTIFILVIFEIVVSFSRGVYLTFLFFLIGCICFIIFRKTRIIKKVYAIFILLLPLLIFCMLFKDDVICTLKFNETISQQRSISGRQDAISSSYNVFKESPIIGTGTQTFSMVINDMRYEDDNIEYTNFAPNSYMQLLTEQGIVGLIIWLFLFITLIFVIKRQDNPFSRFISRVIFFFLVVLFIKEATFPLFFNSSGCQIIVFMLVAILLNFATKSNNSFCFSHIVQNIILVFFPLCCISIIVFSSIYTNDEYHNTKAIISMGEKEYYEALKHVSKTHQRTPYLINRSIIHWEIFKNTKNTDHLFESKKYLKKAIRKNKHDKMLQFQLAMILKSENKLDSAKYILEYLTLKYPDNGLYNFAMFNMLYELGETDRALPYMVKLVELSPLIVGSSYWKYSIDSDSVISNKLKKNLHKNLDFIKQTMKTNNPIELAKFGYILFLFGEHKDAKIMLSEALTLMPNLAYPWLYLSQIENENKMFYLTKFLYLNNNLHTNRDVELFLQSGKFEEMIENRKLFRYDYNTKFENWYKSSTVMMYDKYISTILSN
ncbi:MAG: O-antigen ligase family protein [Prevotellaceae bacterium]|jgi:O-antigen ligase/tetratricopeptide (TPR) repeat protein|nr:O-antigen ligase family protein [Prevotellaceae bacterium]